MREEYEKESLYMAINPYNVAVAKQTYYVKTDHPAPDAAAETRGYAGAIAAAYAQVLTSEGVLETVAEECGIELRYLSELVGASGNEAGMLTLRVIANDLETAEKILRLLDENVDASKEQIEAAVEPHRITRLSYGAYTTADMALAEAQSKRAAALTTRGTEQTNLLEKLEKEYDALAAAPADTTGGAVKSGVKMAVLGAILGAVIACCIVCVQVIFSNRLYSADSLAQRGKIKILGAIPTDAAKIGSMSRFDRMLRAKAGLSAAADAADAYAMAATFLTGAYPEAKTVLVTGGAEETYIQTACEALRTALPEKEILSGGSVLTDADTIRKVGQSDLTVLVEHTGVSCYDEVFREAETIQSLRGAVAGALVMED